MWTKRMELARLCWSSLRNYVDDCLFPRTRHKLGIQIEVDASDNGVITLDQKQMWRTVFGLLAWWLEVSRHRWLLQWRGRNLLKNHLRRGKWFVCRVYEQIRCRFQRTWVWVVAQLNLRQDWWWMSQDNGFSLVSTCWLVTWHLVSTLKILGQLCFAPYFTKIENDISRAIWKRPHSTFYRRIIKSKQFQAVRNIAFIFKSPALKALDTLLDFDPSIVRTCSTNFKYLCVGGSWTNCCVWNIKAEKRELLTNLKMILVWNLQINRSGPLSSVRNTR
jgi:hypothetical protein